MNTQQLLCPYLLTVVSVSNHDRAQTYAQSRTITQPGTYTIVAYAGAGGQSIPVGGFRYECPGAVVSASIVLGGGDTLYVVVGRQGGAETTSAAGGGGGGSFVFLASYSTTVPVLAAGGALESCPWRKALTAWSATHHRKALATLQAVERAEVGRPHVLSLQLSRVSQNPRPGPQAALDLVAVHVGTSMPMAHLAKEVGSLLLPHGSII